MSSLTRRHLCRRFAIVLGDVRYGLEARMQVISAMFVNSRAVERYRLLVSEPPNRLQQCLEFYARSCTCSAPMLSRHWAAMMSAQRMPDSSKR